MSSAEAIIFVASMEGTPQYNGNISQQRWGHASTVSETTNYGYDKLNRLLSGVKTGTVMSEVMTYDDMGNITKLTRDGGGAINYTYSGNKLTTLSGGGLSGTYIYDGNGNATKDRTGMTFSYNYLNLPKTAAKTGSSVSYLYDAMGQKLRKTATVGSVTTVRDYIGGIEYQKTGSAASAIEMIHTDEGYLQRNSSNVYTYHYNLKDHLGNVRATLQRSSATAGTVIQKHDYYPFGKAKALVTSGINKYLYNGKELQGELGGQYDYGARFYDAEIGRWNVVDPMAEKYDNFSPYNYAANNPIKYIDPDGKDIIIFYRVQNTSGKWKNESFRFTGVNASSAPRNYFVDNVIKAYEYNISNGGGQNLFEAANNSDIKIELRQGIDDIHRTGKVRWNPFLAHEYGDITLSPATVLEHEMAHAVSFSENPDAHRNRQATADSQYGNAEERRVITGAERETAIRNGEMKPGQVRKSHEAGKNIKVNDSTSTTEARPFPWSIFDDRFNQFQFQNSNRPFYEW